MNKNWTSSRKISVFRSERFRTPLAVERDFGLWVDRIGTARDRQSTGSEKLRILGLYAAVGVRQGEGGFVSPPTGELKVEEGDAILLFPEIPNRYGPSDDWQTEHVVWAGPEAERMFRLNLFTPEKPVVHGGAEAVHTARMELRPLMEEESMIAIFRRRNIVMDMLLDLFRLQTHDSNKEQAAVAKAVRLINQSLHRNLTVRGLARECGLSETHFRRLFKRVMGNTPKEFIQARKISKAKEYLAEQLPVKEVADRVGFAHESYFRRVFRRITGNTPKVYQ